MIGLVGILSNPSVSLRSHNAGNTHYILSYLRHAFPNAEVKVLTEKDDWNQASKLYITEGVNFREATYNLFGGVSDELVTKLDKLNNYQGAITGFGKEKIYYSPLVQKRIPEMAKHYKADAKIMNDSGIDPLMDGLVLGDSHALSVYSQGMNLSRNDGKTLNGFLKDGIANYLDPSVKHLRFYAGNIDVRHHICRLYKVGDRQKAVKDLVDELKKQLSQLNLERLQIIELLPIEDESRKLPKTGYYEGKPFWGSWRERNYVRNLFNIELKNMCEDLCCEFFRWEGIENILGELDFDKMESKSSVHLAPQFYMFKDTFIK